MPALDSTADKPRAPSLANPPGVLIAVAAVEVVVFLVFGLIDGRWSGAMLGFLISSLAGATYVWLRLANGGDQNWEEAERHRRQQAAVAALGSRALGARSFATIAADATRTLTEARDLAFVCLMRVVDGGRRVVPAEVVGLPGDAAARDIGVDQIEHTLTEGRPVVSDDLAEEERFDATALVEHGMRSSMTALVLFPDGTPYGAIAAYSHRARRASPRRTSTSSRRSPTCSPARSPASRRRQRCSTARCTTPSRCCPTGRCSSTASTRRWRGSPAGTPTSPRSCSALTTSRRSTTPPATTPATWRCACWPTASSC